MFDKIKEWWFNFLYFRKGEFIMKKLTQKKTLLQNNSETFENKFFCYKNISDRGSNMPKEERLRWKKQKIERMNEIVLLSFPLSILTIQTRGTCTSSFPLLSFTLLSFLFLSFPFLSFNDIYSNIGLISFKKE